MLSQSNTPSSKTKEEQEDHNNVKEGKRIGFQFRREAGIIPLNTIHCLTIQVADGSPITQLWPIDRPTYSNKSHTLEGPVLSYQSQAIVVSQLLPSFRTAR